MMLDLLPHICLTINEILCMMLVISVPHSGAPVRKFATYVGSQPSSIRGFLIHKTMMKV